MLTSFPTHCHCYHTERMKLCTVVYYACAAVLSVAWLGEAKLQYMRQKQIYPMTKAQFANGAQNGEGIKLVEVQAKGDLIKWKETINDVPVYGSVITTRINREGNIDRVEGYRTGRSKTPSSEPSITGKEAIDVLRIQWNHIDLTKVNWRLDDPILKYMQGDDGEMKLIWEASYDVDWKDGAVPEEEFGPVPAYIKGLVNAHTGKIEKTWNNLQTAEIEAVVGNNKIGASKVMIGVIQETYMCYHVDEERRVKTYTMGNKRYLSSETVTNFICDWADEKDWDLHNFTGGYSPRNDAFLHGTQFIDLWRKFIGNEVQPYKENDTYLEFYTHYGYEIANAAFKKYFIIIGDGDEKYYPMTALDVVCHEIGHAITEWHGADLQYLEESGAINEAYSDVLGETCDMYYNKKTNYLIGEDLMKPGQKKAIRDMCNPSNFGGLDHYKEYNDTVDVHYSSGIYNKAWCTLSKTKGWDYIKAFRVFTEANLFLWNAETTMHCGACHLENAATDLGLNRNDVTAAFKVVGVNCSECKESMI